VKKMLDRLDGESDAVSHNVVIEVTIETKLEKHEAQEAAPDRLDREADAHV
jgi:hypothetical protein